MTRFVFQRYVTDEQGNVLDGAQITVRKMSDNSLADIYDAKTGGSALSNPFSTSSDGFVQFYADPDLYKVTAVKDAETSTFSNVALGLANQGDNDTTTPPWFVDASGNLVVGAATYQGASGVSLGADGTIRASVSDGLYSGQFIGTTKAIRIEHSSTLSRISGVDSTLSASYQPLAINGSVVDVEIGGSLVSRWDASGNLAVGTAAYQGASGVSLGADGSGWFSASDSTVSPYSEGTTLVVEAATTPGISLLFGDGSKGSIWFGTPTNNASGGIIYDDNNNRFDFSTAQASDVIRFLPDAGVLGLTLSGAAGSELLTAHGDVNPNVTESQDLGSASKEWDNLFVQNAVTVSDKRTKNIIGEMDDAQIDKFLTALDAIWFTKKDIEVVVTPAEPARTESRQVTEKVKQEKASIEVVDGIAIRKVETVEVEQPVFDYLPVVDEFGKPVMVEVSPATEEVLYEEGSVVQEAKAAVYEQATHKVPRMEEVEIPAVEEVRKTISHGRPHSGFTAQQVKAAMDECGIEDWAGYAYDEETDRHFLRPNEFIAVLVKGYQVLKAKVES